MKHGDPLFLLIKSLTRSQKRYFTLTNAGDAEKKYVRLFDAIDTLESYDEERLRALLKGERLLNQLHVAKNYLYELILRTLRSYSREHSAYARILNYLQDHDNLRRIGLPDLAYKRLVKARELAEKYDYLPLQYQATLEARRHLLKSFAFGPALEIAHSAQLELEQMTQHLEYQTINDQLILQHNIDIPPHSRLDLDAVIPRAQRKYEHTAHNRLRTQLAFNAMCFNYHKYSRNLEAALPYVEANLDLLRTHYHLIEDGSFAFPMVVLDYFMCIFYTEYALRPQFRDREQVSALLKDIERCQHPYVGLEIRTMASIARLYIEGMYLTSMGEYKQALDAIDEQWRKLVGKRIPNRIVVESEYLALRAKLLFGLGDAPQALDTINTLLNDRRLAQKVSLDVLVLCLFIYHELDLHSYLPSAIRALRYRLTRDNICDPYVLLAIDVIQQLRRGGASGRPALDELRKRAAVLRSESAWRVHFMSFELDDWIDAYLSNTPFPEVIRQRQLLKTGSAGWSPGGSTLPS